MSLVHLHLLANHVPVIGILFVAFILIAALRLRSSDVARVGLTGLVIVGVAATLVYFTGEPAEEAVENLAGVSESMLHEHEEAAEAAFIAAAMAGVLAVAALWRFRRRDLPRWVLGASLATTVAVSGLMAWTANLGGQIRHSEIRTAAGATDERGEAAEGVERERRGR